MGTYRNSRSKGFTLIELSIVLVIVGILLYIGIAIGTVQSEAAKTKLTNEKLARIEKAINLYFYTNRHLPCPASGSTPLVDADNGPPWDNANFGKGDLNNPSSAYADTLCPRAVGAPNANPKVFIGVVPVRDLNLPDEVLIDGWGNRISYAVSRNCVDRDNWSEFDRSALHKCTTGVDDIVTANDSEGEDDLNFEPGGTIFVYSTLNNQLLTKYAAYLVYSHGRNSMGAFTDEGARIVQAPYSSPFDMDNSNRENADGSGNDKYDEFFRDGPLVDYNAASGDDGDYFDDIIIWKTAPQLWQEAIGQ